MDAPIDIEDEVARIAADAKAAQMAYYLSARYRLSSTYPITIKDAIFVSVENSTIVDEVVRSTDGDFYAFKDVTKLVAGKALVNLDIRTKVYATNGFTGQVISSAEVTLFRGRQQIWPMQWDAAGAIRREISEKLQVFV